VKGSLLFDWFSYLSIKISCLELVRGSLLVSPVITSSYGGMYVQLFICGFQSCRKGARYFENQNPFLYIVYILTSRNTLEVSL